MERIAIAASKIAKGNLFLYNFYVILIALLVCVLLYLLTGIAIFLGLILLRGILSVLGPAFDPGTWKMIFSWSLVCLTFFVFCFYVIAVSKNIRIQK